MAKASNRLPRSRKRINTVDAAIATLGGDERVASWLNIHPCELDRMRRLGYVDRGWFGHFFVSLYAMGHRPAPMLFGLRSWRDVTVPGVASFSP